MYADVTRSIVRPSIDHSFEILSSSLTMSKISPGRHSRASHICSRVLKRIDFIFPVFILESMTGVKPISLAKSSDVFFLFAIITSSLITTDICPLKLSNLTVPRASFHAQI